MNKLLTLNVDLRSKKLINFNIYLNLETTYPSKTFTTSSDKFFQTFKKELLNILLELSFKLSIEHRNIVSSFLFDTDEKSFESFFNNNVNIVFTPSFKSFKELLEIPSEHLQSNSRDPQFSFMKTYLI